MTSVGWVRRRWAFGWGNGEASLLHVVAEWRDKAQFGLVPSWVWSHKDARLLPTETVGVPSYSTPPNSRSEAMAFDLVCREKVLDRFMATSFNHQLADSLTATG